MRRPDKKTKQAEAKNKHKEFINSTRRAEPKLERSKPAIEEKPIILIVCEGKNTEPSYFRQFKLSTVKIRPLGTGFNTLSLVKNAIKLSKKGNYEKTWCVFDKDDFNDNDFNKAIKLAKEKKFGVAYSNQAFEYWIILHFEDHQGGNLHRDSYNEKINTYLNPTNIVYDGNGSKIITKEFFEFLESVDTKYSNSLKNKTITTRRDLAIKRAKAIYNKLNHKSPAKEESSTTVFKLVEELIKYI